MRILILVMILAGTARASWIDRGMHGVELLKQGRVAAASRELQAALKEAEIARENGPAVAAILDALGQVDFGAGRYLSAKKYFERALQIPPQEPTSQAVVLSNAGQACLALGEKRRAEEYFRQALQILPKDPGLWHRLGQAVFLQGKLSEAESAYREALELRNRDATVWSDLAAVLAVRNGPEAAVTLLRQAVAESPAGQGRARILRNLAVFEWKTGARHTAIDHLRAAVAEIEASVGRDHPDVALVLEDYSEALAKMGDKRQSRDAARRAESIRSAFAGQDGGGTVDWRELRKPRQD